MIRDTNPELMTAARKCITDILQCGYPFVDDTDPMRCRIGIAMAIGGLVAKGVCPSNAAVNLMLYLSEASNDEIVSVFREGTSPTAN